MISREPVYAALFAKLQAAAPFVTTSRRFKHFADVAPADQPALFLVQRPESVSTTPGLDSVHELSCDAVVYANARGDDSVVPAAVINGLVDAVFAALKPNPITNKQSLGGLVEHAWVEGQIETDEGLLQEQGYALVPIRMKVAG